MSYQDLKLNEPLLFTRSRPVKQSTLPFRDFNTPRARIAIGMKRSGKGVTMDIDVYKYFNAYFTCIWLHSAGGFENLYPVVNKNCKRKFDTIKMILKVFIDLEENILTKQQILENIPIDEKQLEMFLGLMTTGEYQLISMNRNMVAVKKAGYDMYNGKLLHCSCHSTLPVLWMMPDWIKPKQFTFDWFNGLYFKNYQEYYDAYMKCLVNEYLPPIFFEHQDYVKNPIKKPKTMLEKIKPLLITRHFTTPMTPSRVETFREQIRKIILEAREDHRILVHTPATYPQTHQGKLEMYTTDAELINFLPDLVQKDFVQLDLKKPRSEYTAREKSWHKLALFLGEVRELAPSAKLSGDPESSVSKRALYNFMPKSRHQYCWPFMDLQAASDMFTGVRTQNDIRIIKRSTSDMLGEEFGWFYNKIEKMRIGIIESKGFTMKSAPFEVMEELNTWLPNVDDIPDNKGYVIFPNNEHRLVKFNMTLWHHKSDRDNFFNDTGIEYVISKDKETDLIKETGKKSTKPDKKFSKKLTNDDWIIMHSIKQKGKKWPQIIEEMQKKDRENGIEVNRFEAKDPIKNISNQYNRWKLRENID